MTEPKSDLAVQEQVAAVMCALETATETIRRVNHEARPDRELVAASFATLLAKLKQAAQPVVFHPNMLDMGRALIALREAGLPDAIALRHALMSTLNRDGLSDALRDMGQNTPLDVVWRPALRSQMRYHALLDSEMRYDAFLGTVWRGMPRSGIPLWHDAALRDINRLDAVSRDPALGDAVMNIRRGGMFNCFFARDAIHVVLATMYRENGDRARIHRPDGPAVQYEDGSGLFFWRGIRVPEKVITSPLEVKQVLDEPNAEVRRAMMERYGLERFVLDAGARSIDKWKDNELLAIDLPHDRNRPLVALKLRCPSTQAVYIVRVPPNQKTVLGALAWSFGLDRPEDYVLQAES